MTSHCRKPAWLDRVAALGLIVFVGLLVSGCTAQYIKDIESAAKTLRSSDEFTDVNFEYQREFDPTRPRDLYDFSAALRNDADLERAGQLLAEAVDMSGKAPDILVDGSTWVHGFYDGKGSRAAAELTPQTWTEVLEIARSPQVQELEVWSRDSYFAKEFDDHEPKLAVKFLAETDAAGLDSFLQLDTMDVPAEFGDFHVELYTGTETQPVSWQSPALGEYRPWWYTHAPIEISGPSDTNVWKGPALLEAAHQHFGEVYGFSLTFTDQDEIPIVEVFHDGQVATCLENKIYAELVGAMLAEDFSITISAHEDPDGWALKIYHEVSEASAERGGTSEGCHSGRY